MSEDIVTELDALIAVEPRTPAYPLLQRVRDEIVALRERLDLEREARRERIRHASATIGALTQARAEALEEAARYLEREEPMYAAEIRALKDAKP